MYKYFACSSCTVRFLLFQLNSVELIDCLNTLDFNECLCVRPSPGNHVEEDEGENEEAQHRADNVGITGGSVSTPSVERWGVTY